MADQRGNVKKTLDSPHATLKRNKNGKPIFEGQLAKPITYPPRPLADLGILPDGVKTAEEAGALWREQWTDMISAREAEKLLALLNCYGLRAEPPDWRGLANMLAKDFVPGLKVRDPDKRRRGRPSKSWSDLFEAVEEILQRNPKLTIAAACLHLKRKKGPWYGENARSLAARYNEDVFA
jgi:hypothetical protein